MTFMESVADDDEIKRFKERSVLALGIEDDGAGSFIAEKLNERGWSAEGRSVSGENNFVLKEDLMFIGSIVFESDEARKIFESNKELAALVLKNDIKIYTLDLKSKPEEDLEDGAESEFGKELNKKLDEKGFKEYEEKT